MAGWLDGLDGRIDRSINVCIQGYYGWASARMCACTRMHVCSKLLLWVVSSQTFVMHPKIISLPLGMSSPAQQRDFAMQLARTGLPPKKTLVGWDALSVGLDQKRGRQLKWLKQKMGGTLTVREQMSVEEYRNFIVESKFILSPPGLGEDCYRTWETLFLGAIPVIEHSTFDRVFERLPVLLVDSYSELNAEFLNRKFEEMTCHPEQYDWSRLTLQYWTNLIGTVIRTADNSVVQTNHPIRVRHNEACFSARADWLGTLGVDDAKSLL